MGGITESQTATGAPGIANLHQGDALFLSSFRQDRVQIRKESAILIHGANAHTYPLR